MPIITNVTFPSFPFTVKYEWEIKCNNGLSATSPSFRKQTFSKEWNKRHTGSNCLPDKNAGTAS